MSPLLMAYEQDCQASRNSSPNIRSCLTQVYEHLGSAPDPAFAKVNQKIIDLLEIDAQILEHAYHNRNHVCDVLKAVVLLLKHTDIAPKAHVSLMECLITAALGHDLHHDGRGTMSELDLERRSATGVLAIGQEAGLPQADLDFIEGVILATYPPVQLKLRQQLAEGGDLDPNEMLALMFGEADVLASLTPTFGKSLSVALSTEWRKAGLIFASMPDEEAGRAKFLGCYRLVTPSAQRLGVDAMVLDQLRILQRNLS